MRITATDSRRTLENPTPTQLHDLLADLNLRHPFAVIARGDGDYIQVHLDDTVPPERGHAYHVEFREGGPETHRRAELRDDRPWGAVHSPAFETVVRVIQDWAAGGTGWRTALPWEPAEL